MFDPIYRFDPTNTEWQRASKLVKSLLGNSMKS
jgi:hypothetical protein